MLEPLIRYARDHDLAAAPGLTVKDVKWAIQLADDGRFTGVVELGDAGAKRNRGRRFRGVPTFTQPEIKRGGAGTRHFLVDNADVVARLSGEDDPKLNAKHDHFVDLLRQAGSEIPVPELALCTTTLADLESERAIRKELLAKGAKPTENVTFVVAGAFPVASTAWHGWWQAFRAGLAAPAPTGAAAAKMRCLASGELVSPERTHLKIRGLTDVGGLPTGDVLASFKQDSFRSYGLVQSENAAVSAEMVATYQAALNHLIANNSHRLGEDAKVVYWYHGAEVKPEEDLLAGLLTTEDVEDTREASAHLQARELLRAIDTGKRPDLLDARFIVWTLSGASGRVMVRDLAQGSFRELAETVDAWFSHLAIVQPRGEGLAAAPAFWRLLRALAREKIKEVPAPLVTELWRSALHPELFPAPAAAQALLRVRSDVVTGKPLRAERFGVLKAYWIRHHQPEGNPLMLPGLNPEHPEPAYQCGRLMAMLAALQRRALGDVGAGVVQRYYAAASATPGLVLGRLLRTAQFHLEKLQPGLRFWYEGRIAEIAGHVDSAGFPNNLDLAGQSLFALGYYHQLAENRRKKSDTDPEPTEETANDA